MTTIVRLTCTLLALSAGCGRIGFDDVAATSDSGTGDSATPVCIGAGHDEDADSFPDTCDPCPHIAGDLADSDGDGVGDACDPRPGSMDRIAFFDPFVARDPGWMYGGNPGTLVGDALALDRRDSSIFGIRNVTGDPRGTMEIGLALTTPRNTTLQRQFVLAAGDIDANDYVFCELNQFGTSQTATVGNGRRRDGTTFTDGTDALLAGDLENRDTILRFGFGATHPCSTTWPGQACGPSSVNVAVPTPASGTVQIGFYGFAVDTEFRYFVLIEAL